MAAPLEKTLQDLNGRWVVNKQLSDSADAGLALQGIGYLLRKGIGLATIQITVAQYAAAPSPPAAAGGAPVTHIDIDQSASGLSSTREERCVDDLPRRHTDWLFGAVDGRSRWLAPADVDDAYLGRGWLLAEGERLLFGQAVSVDNGWVADQIWGFQMVAGERRYCRNIVIRKGDKRAEFRFVYDYVGAA